MVKQLGLKEWILLVLFLMSIAFLCPPSITNNSAYPVTAEKFDPALKNINSIKEFIKYTDHELNSTQKSKLDTVLYVEFISEAVKRRFMFGLAEYTFGENWIANLAGKFVWSHFSAKVEPDDILKDEVGLCSQQSIVFMELLRNKGIRTRSVGLGFKEGPGHFLCEVNYGGAWHMYDVTKEPHWNLVSKQHESMSYLLQRKDLLFKIYENIMTKAELEKITEKVEYGVPGEFPAKNMRLFHKLSHYLTYILPLLFLFLFNREYRKRMKNKEH